MTDKNNQAQTSPTLSVIGVGAFGELMIKHLAPHFDVHIFDPARDLAALGQTYGVRPATLENAAKCEIVLLAVPVREIEGVARKIAPFLTQGQLVMDVASVKCLPKKIFLETLPPEIDLVGLHPLFGPQSGKNGIKGLNVAVVNVRGDRADGVAAFLRDKLELSVFCCTAEQHDEQAAYVMGLTHMIARVFKEMDVPEIYQTTRTYELLSEMVNLIKNDSEELFRAIQTDNPFVAETKRRFFDSVRKIEKHLEEQK